MLRPPVKTALLIDYENIPIAAAQIANLVQWVEDGRFDPQGRRRKLMSKRVYWNSQAEVHRDVFTKLGFKILYCGKFANMKNGADIRMALDIAELIHIHPSITEYILITSDSDFVPVIDRLAARKKRSVMVVKEHEPHRHTIYRERVDILIPARTLKSAGAYRRPPASLAMRLRSLLTRQPKPRTAPQPGNGSPSVAQVEAAETAREDAINQALERVIALTTKHPGQETARTRVFKELRSVPGFTQTGAAPFWGTGSYRELMRELSRRDRGLKLVEQSNDGFAVMFDPPSKPKPKTSAPRQTGNGSQVQDQPVAEPAAANQPATEQPATDQLVSGQPASDQQGS